MRSEKSTPTSPPRTTTWSSTRSQKRSELIASVVRREIVHGVVDGTLAPGTALPPERELLALFDVARPTLREAMRILESDGLIELRVGANGGAFVRTPPPELAARHVATLLQLRGTTLGSVMAARLELACTAARLAAQRATKRQISDLRAIAEDVAADAGAGKVIAHEAVTFHQALMALSGNDTLILLSSVLNDIFDAHYELAERLTKASISSEVLTKRNRAAATAMRRLIELIEAGDATGAEAFWREHLAAVSKLVSEYVGSTQVVDALINVPEMSGGPRLWPTNG